MIFHEIYGCYYRAVAGIIEQAVTGHLTEKKMNEIAAELAFEESMLTIVPALKSQKWQLIDHSFRTPIRRVPKIPLTALGKRWLKTMLLDPRVRLFHVPDGCRDALADVEPLFEPADVVYYDRYLDGDPYQDSEYEARFRLLMDAIYTKRKVRIEFVSARHKKRSGIWIPVSMEYSDKEDKFRVLCAGDTFIRVINVGRITRCSLVEEAFGVDAGGAPGEAAVPEMTAVSGEAGVPEITAVSGEAGVPEITAVSGEAGVPEMTDVPEASLPKRQMEDLTFRLADERNCLERVMMRFSHLEKQVEKTGERQYLVHIRYDRDDAADILIQLMSFGPYLTILEPESLLFDFKKRLQKQLELMDW